MDAEREKIEIPPEVQPLLVALHAKAMDSLAPDSILHDRWALETADRIDFDLASIRIDRNAALSIAIRASTLDEWTRAFLAEVPDAVVLNLACGFDSRVFRVDPPPGVRWFDLDRSEVVDVRRKLYPERENYRLIGTSLTDPGWLQEVPRDRPAMIVVEGVMPYLGVEEAPKLISRLVGHFPGGELAFDGYNRLGLRLLRLHPSVQASRTAVHWAVEDPRAVEKLAPGLRLVEEQTSCPPEHLARLPGFPRMMMRFWSLFPSMRRIARLLRYRF